MDRARMQERIDQIDWYHEFDFGNGLVARPRQTPYLAFHRVVWKNIAKHLDEIDFQGKSVLDIGCWDGYWSFEAERRGARSVLASDDCSQQWVKENGLLLARELLGSSIEVNQQLSVYELSKIGRKFDVILCLGVYYHLFDPFHAFAQIRHCCHDNTLVVIEGDGVLNCPEGTQRYDLSDPAKPIFVPTRRALEHMLRGAYLEVGTLSSADLSCLRPVLDEPPPGRVGWRWRLRMCWQALKGSRSGTHQLSQVTSPPIPTDWAAPEMTRFVAVCKPFRGSNPLHYYRPPFGLDAYDDRFCLAA